MISELEKLEPVFIEAGKAALLMQKGIKYDNKHESGNFEIDVVTEADRTTQETILKAMAKTPLVDCHLIPEEDTPSVKKFNTSGNLFLTIDPIDGTALYVKGKKFWSVIVSLHNEKEMLYTFAYFPAVNWTNKIVGNKYEVIGDLPKINIETPLHKTIVHSYGVPTP
jgi:fructose-1,6-bisphosphatase/inositol monophosphatase family enzyme